jgi:hypothetical protein
MSDMIKYQPQLPVVIQSQLDRQSHRMSYITKVATAALGEQSNVYSFTVFEVFRTLTTITALKEAFAKTGMPPETEALLEILKQNYLQAMERIPQQTCGMILQVLESASVAPDDGGWLGALIDAFIGRSDQ